MAYSVSGLTQQQWVVYPSWTDQLTMVNGTGDQIDNINEPWDSPDDSTYLWTNGGGDAELWFYPDWDTQPKRYQTILCCVRVKSNGTGTCEIRLYGGGGDFRGGTNGISFDISAYTDWTNIIFPARIFAAEDGNPESNSKDYIDPSTVLHRWRADVSGGGEVYISNHAWFAVPATHHAFLEVDGDGSTTDWSKGGAESTDWESVAKNFASQDMQTTSTWGSTSPFNDKSTYLYPTATNQEQHFTLQTPSLYSPDDGDWDYFDIIVFMHNEDGATGKLNNVAECELYESGAAITEFHPDVVLAEQLTVSASYHATASVDFYRFYPRRFKSGKPVNWANVELRIKYTGSLASTEDPKLYGIVLGGIFGYDPPVNQNLTVTDTVSITGATVFSRGQSLAVTDTINTADATSRIQNLQLNAASSVAITGAISRTLAASMAKTDTVNLADVSTLGIAASFSLVDTFNQVDTVQQAAALALSIADSLNLTDAVTRVLGASLTVNDSFNTGDVDAFVQGLLESYTDTITLTDAVTILVIQIVAAFDTLNLSDAFSAQLTAIKTATDTIQLSDALTSLLQAAASHSDFVQYADALTATASFVKAFTDTTNVIDAITMSSQAIKALSDTFGLADTTALVSALAKAHTDTFTLADVIGLQLGLTSIFESGVSFGDAVTIRTPQLVSLSDTIQFWDWAGFTASATATPTFTLAGIVVAASVTMLAVNVVPNINISGLRIDPSIGLDSVDIT